MNSREKILETIRKNKAAGYALPELPEFATPPGDPVKAFTLAVEGAGGTALELGTRNLQDLLSELFPAAEVVYSMVPELDSRNLDFSGDPHQLENIDLTVLSGQLGVAENGAVWVTERQLGQRVSAYIAQHLILVLSRDHIVRNMLDAYRRIRIDETGFGAFIAGPSKTADIEQALVIGAQGPRSLTVVLK